ncbi:MAG: aldo/keto reductase [Candidatus Aminicenantes bacterium]|nr:aldo/keto reductase [Candidatus Aminicenantes bacterium]
MNRRNFVTAMTSGLFGLGVSKHLGAEPLHRASGPQEAATPKIRKYRDLGKTGLKVPDVSFGAISLFEPNVLRYACECGVTYFDTAESYLRMKGETYVGQGLKEVRDKVIITTKHGQNFRQKIEKDAFIQRVEASLKRLQTDRIDVAMIHNVDDLSLALNNQELMSAYAQLKKDGKVRFTGFSTHNAKQTLKQALDTDFAQIVLVMYNHMEGKEIEPLVKAVREKGIGTVAMKIFAGGMQGNLKPLVDQRTSYSQAAIRWVLSNPDFDTCIPTMSSYSHVEEYVGASGQPLDRAALQTLAVYREEVNSVYCRVSCRDCLSACPHQVAVNDVLRFAMYYEHYGMERQALDYYAELKPERKPLNCAGCPAPCQSACPYGLQVRSKLLRTHDILSA